jgi:hypothetical protein
MDARGVVDPDLAETKAPIAGQDGYVPVPFAVYHHFIEHCSPIAFEAAVDVVEPDAGQL